jgi:hypothetical protein
MQTFKSAAVGVSFFGFGAAVAAAAGIQSRR